MLWLLKYVFCLNFCKYKSVETLKSNFKSNFMIFLILQALQTTHHSISTIYFQGENIHFYGHFDLFYDYTKLEGVNILFNDRKNVKLHFNVIKHEISLSSMRIYFLLFIIDYRVFYAYYVVSKNFQHTPIWQVVGYRGVVGDVLGYCRLQSRA